LKEEAITSDFQGAFQAAGPPSVIAAQYLPIGELPEFLFHAPRGSVVIQMNAGLHALRAADLNWTHDLQSVWSDSCFQVDEIHQSLIDHVVDEFFARTRKLTDNPIGKVILGEAGAGKTHLIGTLRVRLKTLSRIAELSQHEVDGGEFQEGEAAAVSPLPGHASSYRRRASMRIGEGLRVEGNDRMSGASRPICYVTRRGIRASA
jgi:hypothetical protein